MLFLHIKCLKSVLDSEWFCSDSEIQSKPLSFQMQVEQFCSGDLWHTVKIPGGRLQYLAENCLQIPGNPEINRSLAFLQSKEQKAKS